MKNGHRKLDLTALVEPIELTIGEYTCTITGDMSIPALARMSKAFSSMQGMSEGDIDVEALGVSEDEMWELVAEVFEKATPPPPEPVRDLLTTQAAIKVLTFLANTVSAGITETPAS